MNLNEHMELTYTGVATMKEIEALCNQAITGDYPVVCVNPYYVSLASELLKNQNIDVATVIGSEEMTSVKSYAAIDAIQNGATEIHFLLNASMVKNKVYDDLKDEIEEIRDSIDGKTVKVIVDVSLFNEEELHEIIKVCNDCFIHYVDFIIRDEQSDFIKHLLQHKGDILDIKITKENLSEEEILEWLDYGVSRFTKKGEIR